MTDAKAIAKARAEIERIIAEDDAYYFIDANGVEWVKNERSKELVSHQLHLRWKAEKDYLDLAAENEKGFDFDDEVRWILGRPNFACVPLAMLLRKLGHDIKLKAEDEQAAVLHFMLNLYFKHGNSWREELGKYLDKAIAMTEEQPE